MYMKPNLIYQAYLGNKTLTTRLLKPGERVENGIWYTAGGRIKYQEGRNNALCPKRGHKQVARIEILKLWSNRLQEMPFEDCLNEGLQPWKGWVENMPIGFYFDFYGRWGNDDYSAYCEAQDEAILDAFIKLWDSINNRPGIRWADNHLVVRIRFRFLEIAPNFWDVMAMHGIRKTA